MNDYNDYDAKYDAKLHDLIQRSIPEFQSTVVTSTVSTVTVREIQDAINKVKMYQQYFEEPYVIDELEEP